MKKESKKNEKEEGKGGESKKRKEKIREDRGKKKGTEWEKGHGKETDIIRVFVIKLPCNWYIACRSSLLWLSLRWFHKHRLHSPTHQPLLNHLLCEFYGDSLYFMYTVKRRLSIFYATFLGIWRNVVWFFAILQNQKFIFPPNSFFQKIY